jgi:hypothetical protein
MIVQVLLAAVLLLLAWWLLTDSDQVPDEAAGSEVVGNQGEPAPLRPGVPVAHPAPEQAHPRPDEDYPARVG